MEARRSSLEQVGACTLLGPEDGGATHTTRPLPCQTRPRLPRLLDAFTLIPPPRTRPPPLPPPPAPQAALLRAAIRGESGGGGLLDGLRTVSAQLGGLVAAEEAISLEVRG
jgi:hypothetical protein